MTHRERWLRHLRFEPVDYIPDEEFGYWDNTFRRWHREGLPEEINNNSIADQYFGFAPRAYVPINMGLIPTFEYKVLEDAGRYRVVQDGSGVISKVFTDGTDTIPTYLDFPLKGRREWEELFKPRLDPTTPGRYPADWDAHVARLRDADAPVVVGGGSLFGWLRDWAGFEGIALMVYDDPQLFEDMVEHLCWFITTLLERAVRDIKTIDASAFWEDMCYRAGCIISPKTFRRYLTPRYKRITDLLAKAGCHINYLDCDGNIMGVIDCWAEGGINCMFPVEVAAGSDPLEIRRKYGHDVLMLGGVNKRALAAGREAIDAELRRIEAAVKEGGWIPHVDHRVPPDVSYNDYLYYLKRKREVFGIPEPEPWEIRKARAERREPAGPAVMHFDEREEEDRRIKERFGGQEGKE
ncbi:MAG: uroporphyrinogen decarboxylase family protein [Armatimonadota bacterium]